MPIKEEVFCIPYAPSTEDLIETFTNWAQENLSFVEVQPIYSAGYAFLTARRIIIRYESKEERNYFKLFFDEEFKKFLESSYWVDEYYFLEKNIRFN